MFATVLMVVACGSSHRDSNASSLAASSKTSGSPQGDSNASSLASHGESTAALVAAPTIAATTSVETSYTLGHFPAVPTRRLPSATIAKLQATLDAAVEHGLPSMTATVLAAGRGTWSGVAGTADGAHPVVARSQYGIGSVSKTVIAAEIMWLSERGKLGLDDPVSEHLPPRFRFNAKGVTIKDLLSLTAGIPDPQPPPGTDPVMEHPLHRWTPEEVLSYVPTDRSTPGVEWFYGDSNYILLALVVQHTTGTSVAAALRKHVLADPRLSSLVYQTDERPTGPVTLPYVNGVLRSNVLKIGGGYLPTASEASSTNGSGGMASDSPALALFGYELFGRHVLSPRSLKAMTTWVAGDHDPYGLGVFNLTHTSAGGFGDGYAFGNGGEVSGGYSSLLVVLPKRGIVISALTNTNGGPGDTVGPYVRALAATLVAPGSK
jgi:D-alanyl-D-alanine carboxypeptidase